MGAAKRKQNMTFPQTQIGEWESDDCVNFAVALARLSGWLIHIDWLSDEPTPDDERAVTKMTPLRVYVGNDGHKVFDVRGIKTFYDFTERTIRPLAIERKKPWIQQCGVATRYYGEAKLATLPLRSMPNEAKVLNAMTVIRSVPAYLAAIPERSRPRLPAEEAAKFTWGKCSIYAEALSAATGLEPFALMVARFHPLFGNSKNGYVHSMVKHPDGTVEDSWGRVPPQHIAERFGAVEWCLNTEEHRRVVGNLKRNSPEQWHQQYVDQGLVIIGVHSPEFSYEKDVEKVRHYLKDQNIRYLVPIDNDFSTWNRYGNRYWPSMYLIDKRGLVRYVRVGEGGYQETERLIQSLLQEKA